MANKLHARLDLDTWHSAWLQIRAPAAAIGPARTASASRSPLSGAFPDTTPIVTQAPGQAHLSSPTSAR